MLEMSDTFTYVACSLAGQPHIGRKEVGLVDLVHYCCPAALDSAAQSDCSILSHDQDVTDMYVLVIQSCEVRYNGNHGNDKCSQQLCASSSEC